MKETRALRSRILPKHWRLDRKERIGDGFGFESHFTTGLRTVTENQSVTAQLGDVLLNALFFPFFFRNSYEFSVFSSGFFFATVNVEAAIVCIFTPGSPRGVTRR